MLSGVPVPHFDSTLRRMRILRSALHVGKSSTPAHPSWPLPVLKLLHFRRRDFLQKRSDTTTAWEHILAVGLLARPQKKLFPLARLLGSLWIVVIPMFLLLNFVFSLFASAQRKRERNSIRGKRDGKSTKATYHFSFSLLKGYPPVQNCFLGGGFLLFLLFPFLISTFSLFLLHFLGRENGDLTGRDNILCPFDLLLLCFSFSDSLVLSMAFNLMKKERVFFCLLSWFSFLFF